MIVVRTGHPPTPTSTMTIKHHLPILSACTLTFLLFVLRFPTATSQEITFTEEPKDSYYIVKKRPVTISCAARHAVDIGFTCGGAKIPPTSVQLEVFSESDPEVVKASITVTRTDVTSFSKKEKYWCECNAISIDGSVAITSKRGMVSNAILKYRFKKQPTSQRVIDGESVEFVCDPPVSDPKPEIFWKKDNRRMNMKADDRLVLSDTGSLLIDSVTADDEGTYSCVAKSPAGRRESKKADLNVAVLAEATESEEEITIDDSSSGAKSREQRETDKPFFSSEPKAVYYIKPEEELTIDCGVTSANIITFRCNGVRTARSKQSTDQGLDSDGNRIIQSQLKVLYSEVLDFHRENGNEAAYQCQCVGWYQKDRTRWLSILSSKNIGVVKLAYLETTFRTEPSDVTVGQNTQATLRCEPPKGQPSPWVYWFKDDVKIDPRSDTTYQVSREGNLIIPSAQFSDTGRYKCVAENIVKQVESRVAELRVSATAPPPTTPTTTIATTGITIPEDLGDDPVFLQDLPDETPINQQGVAKLTCIIYAATMLSIDCNGRRLPESEHNIDRTMNEQTGKTIITVTTEVGAGDVRANPDGYSCRCTGWVLDAQRKWQKLNGNIGFIVEKKTVFIGDEFIYPPKDLEVYFEDQTEIPCEPPEGSPMPKVHWLKDGNIVKPEEDSNFKVLQAGTLVLEFARMEDQGLYVCVAENEAGTRRSGPAKLTVLGGDSSNGCEEQMMKCHEIISTAASSGDPNSMCTAIDEYRECIMDLQCPPEMQTHLEKALETIDQTATMCSTTSSCVTELSKCQQLLSTDDQCGSLSNVKMCLMDLQCPAEMQPTVDNALSSLEETVTMCQGEVGPTTISGIDYTDSDMESTTFDYFDTTHVVLLEPFFTEVPEPVNYIMTSGQSVTLSCTVIAAKSLLFACNGQTLKETATTGFVTQDESGHTIRENSLTITAQQVESYQGAEPYSCVCKGYAQREETGEWYSVDSKPGTIQKAFLDHDFIQEPMSKQAAVGEMVTLICVPPKGVPSPSVSWIFNGFRLSESDNIMATEDGTLVIKSFTEDEEGEYTCSAQNMLGQRTSQSVDLTIGASMASTPMPDMTSEGQETKDSSMVYTSMPDMTSEGGATAEPAPVTMAPYKGEPYFSKDLYSVYYVTKNKPVSILCEATGVNDITFNCRENVDSRVSKNASVKEVVMEDGTTDYVNMMEAVVTVSKKDLEGFDEYSCICKGHYDNEGTLGYIDSQEAWVELAYLKRKFVKEPENVRVEEGSFLTLSCQPPLGNPMPEVSWLKDGEPVQRVVYPGGTLAIEHATMLDGGEYNCVAKNAASKRVSAPFLVEVLPGQSMTTPDDVIGTGEGSKKGESTTEDSGIEVVEITSVPLTSDTMDEQTTMFNGFTSTDKMTSEPTNEETTTYMESMSTDGGMIFMKTSPTGKMSDTSEMSSQDVIDTSSASTTEEMSSILTQSTEDITMVTGDVTDDMFGMEDTTRPDMTHNKEETDPTMPVEESTKEDTFRGETQPTPEPSVPAESTPYKDSTYDWSYQVTMVDEYQTCQEVIEKCQKSLPSGDRLDHEQTCQGDDSYLNCMENFLNGCHGVVDEAVMTNARESFEMAKDMCMQYETCPELKRCRYIYYEGSMYEEDESASLPLSLFCRDIGNFMHCADATMAECGVTMANPTRDDVSSHNQIFEWFYQYCDRFVLQDTSLASCDVMTDCDLPIDVASKDNSTYWCRMTDTLQACTNNSISLCGLSDLRGDLAEMSRMKSDIGCSMEMPMKGGNDKGETSKGSEGEGEASTQASIEDCDGDKCGASSMAFSILLISLIQLALAFFLTEPV